MNKAINLTAEKRDWKFDMAVGVIERIPGAYLVVRGSIVGHARTPS